MSDRTYLVKAGLDTPDERFEVGDEVLASQIPERSLPWLVRDGVLEEVASEPVDATSGALELAEQHEDLDLADVFGTGKDGRVTKEDVEKHLAALEEAEETDG